LNNSQKVNPEQISILEITILHDEIKLSYIGLTDLEIRVLKSIFTLAPQLKENFILITPEFINEADVILVNADNPENILEWEKVARINNLTSS
jgi:hypothetical protein